MIGMILAWAVTAAALQPETWMDMQIEDELKPFCQGINSEQVKKSFHRIQSTFDGDCVPIILVKIVDGTCTWDHPKNLEKSFFPQAEGFCKAIELLQPLPDLSLLVSLDYNCERPIYLHASSVPIFSISKSKRNTKVLLFPKGVLFPHQSHLYTSLKKVSLTKAWQKRRPVVLWRPKTLKNEYLYNDWEWDPAIRLLLLGKRHPDCLDFHLAKDFYFKKIPWWAQNLFLKSGLGAPPLKPEDHLDYRYLLACPQMDLLHDLDWQLFSGSTVIKTPAKLYQWFDCQLKANEHFLPILSFGEDLIDRIEWLKENDEKASVIAQNARSFAEHMFSEKTECAYFLRLLQAYSNIYH